MKLTFFLLAVLGLSYGTTALPVQSRGLNEDLQDFINLIPVDKVAEIVKNNLNDPEIQAVIEFIYSEECKDLVIEISRIPEWRQVVSYLDTAGLPVLRWIQWVHDLVGITRSSFNGVSPRGVNSVIQEIKAVLPIDKIAALYREKLVSSPDFKTLVDKLQSPVFKGLTDALAANKGVQKIVARLEAVGVDVKGFIDLLKTIFGLSHVYASPVRGLNEDLQDFINLIPVDKIVEIVKNNLNDPEVQAVIEFIYSAECKALVIEISQIPEWKQVVAYLDAAGLPVQRWIQWVHDLLGITRSSFNGVSPRGVNSVIQEIKAVLPIDKIAALYREKLVSSPDFKTLVDKLQSPVFKGLTDALAANKGVQKIVARLEAVGVDVKGFIALLKTIFGLSHVHSSPVRGLNEDLQDFINLIPVDEIVEIVKNNLNDPEVQAVIEFIYSEECKALVIEISQIPEWKQVVAYLDAAGLPVRRWIQWVHDLLGITRSSFYGVLPRGVNSVIQEIKAVLPIDKIAALYREKLVSSPDFKTLVDKLQSPVFKGLTDALAANKGVQKIVARLEAVGVDVKGFIALLKTIFGLSHVHSSPVRGLNEDLQDFINLIPVEKIVEIVKNNLSDPEVQAVIEFIYSEECKALVIEISQIPEWKQVVAYLDAAGLPVRRWIQWVHDLLGITRSSFYGVLPRGVNSVIQEIKAVLPFDKIAALYREKLVSSPDFKTLVDKLQSPVFKGLTDALAANNGVQKIVARLEAVGVDVKGFIALLKEIFGLSF